MPIDSEGRFYLECSEKQLEIRRACLERTGRRKYIFINGPKWTGKTRGALSAVVEHAWNVKNARICVIVPTIGAGDDSGVWSELIEKEIPRWIEGDFGLTWWEDKRKTKQRTGAKQKGASKKLYCEITNKHPCDACNGSGKKKNRVCDVCLGNGCGKSHIEMDSLKDERDVEKDFFNRYYTMIYWGELQNFKERHTFDTLIQCLRVDGVPNDDDYLMLCDGNPSDLGEDAWQYKLWFDFRVDRDVPPEQKPLQQNLKLIIVTLADNPYLSDQRKREIESSYDHDPDLKARYILGQWKKSSSDALFAGSFKQSMHVIDVDTDGNPVELVPEADCISLISSWDPGGANPAMVIAEKCWREIVIKGDSKEEAIFKFIDELVFVKGDISIAEFTELVMEKLEYWEKYIGRPIKWQHWSDNSAFTQKESISKRTVYEEVYAASGGKIELEASDSQYRFGKGNPQNRPGTVAQGIRLWRKLLFQNRILMCNRKTPKLIQMCKSLRRKPKTTADIIAENDNNRHVFDAGRYLVSRECYDELQTEILDINNAKTAEVPDIISIRL